MFPLRPNKKQCRLSHSLSISSFSLGQFGRNKERTNLCVSYFIYQLATFLTHFLRCLINEPYLFNRLIVAAAVVVFAYFRRNFTNLLQQNIP